MPLQLRRRAPLIVLVLALLASFGWWVGAPRAHAQDQPGISLQVRAGCAGAYRPFEWFPVIADVSNDGPDVRAVLEWSFPIETSRRIFQRVVDLPRGSRKHIVFDAYTAEYARNGLLRLLDGTTELAARDVNLKTVDDTVFLAGVVSSDPTLLNTLSAVQLNGYSSAEPCHLTAADLPDSVAALRGLDALFLHDIDSAALSPAQREALALWASLGGQLVVSGGAGGQAAAAGLADLLPARVSGEVSQGSLAELADLAGSDAAALPATTTLSAATAQPGAEQLPPGSGLIFRHRYGAGLVSFSTFDLAVLRGWAGEDELWSQVLQPIVPLSPGGASRLSQFNLLDRGVLKLPSLSLPSPWMLLLFVLVYVLAIGPLNYLALRRLRRLELAWLTIPAVVLLFTAGLYVVGTLLRGGDAQYNQLSIVESSEGQARGYATSFIGLFSPQRANYTLTFPAATHVTNSPGQLFLDRRFDPVVIDEAGVPSIRLLADIASVTTFVAESLVDLPVRIETSLTSGANGISGSVRNSGQLALEDVVIVRGESYVRLGRLDPGASAQVRFENAEDNFPSTLSLSSSGVFDRQPIVNTLFDSNLIRQRLPSSTSSTGSDGIYLLGWANQAAIAANLNNQNVPQNGLTLYVLRLKE